MNNHDHITINSDYPYIYIHTLLAGASYPPFWHSRISIISSSVKLRGIPLRGGSGGRALWPLFLILSIIIERKSWPWLIHRLHLIMMEKEDCMWLGVFLQSSRRAGVIFQYGYWNWWVSMKQLANSAICSVQKLFGWSLIALQWLTRQVLRVSLKT